LDHGDGEAGDSVMEYGSVVVIGDVRVGEQEAGDAVRVRGRGGGITEAGAG
jgi:hypothetical protein